jgi:multisubunit Na+/H+ antiporter MnhG subunit
LFFSITILAYSNCLCLFSSYKKLIHVLFYLKLSPFILHYIFSVLYPSTYSWSVEGQMF